MAKLFSVLGVLAVLGVGAGGIAGAMLVKDRLRVEIRPDVPQDDGLSLVRDDLKSVREDLEALTQAIGAPLELVGAALAEQKDANAADARSVLAALVKFERALALNGERIARVEQQVAALGAREPVAAMPSVPRAESQPAGEPAIAEATPVPAPTGAAADPGQRTPGPETPRQEAPGQQSSGAGAAAPKKGGFGFALPSRAFRFDQLQTYEIVPELSRVGFDAKSTLHDFSGVTSKVRGEFAANFAAPDGAFTGSIVCEAAALATGVDGRDAAMREHLDTEHHAEIRYAIESFTPDERGVDAAKMTCEGTVAGTMEIRGKKKAFSVPVKVRVDESRRVVVEGQAVVHLPDYEVPVPSQLGLINMQPDVVVWVALRARVQKAVTRAR